MPEQSYTISPLNPDEMVGSRPSGFVAVVTLSRYMPWCLPKSETGKHMFYAGWRLTPEEDEGLEPWIEHYKAAFLPSMDFPGTFPTNDDPSTPEKKVTPVGADLEFYKQLAAGNESIPEGEEEKYMGLYAAGPVRKDFEWGQVCRALKRLEFDKWAPPSMANFEGLKCLFELVPQENKSKGQEKEYQVLVPTKILGYVETAKAAKSSKKTSAAAGTSTKAAEANGKADLPTVLARCIVAGLADSGVESEEGDYEGMKTLPASQVQKVLFFAKSKADKAGFTVSELVAASKNADVLSAGSGFEYDPSAGLFVLTE